MKKYFNKFLTLFITAALITGCENETPAEPETSAVTESEIISEEPSPIIGADNGLLGELISIYPYADFNPDYKAVEIDGKTLSRDFLGLGITVDEVSAGLLSDYKENDVSAYESLMEKLFAQEIGFSHIKIVDSFNYDFFDINKNSAFFFVYDALQINPDITLELSADSKRCIDIIESAYDVYGLEFNYICFKEVETDNFTAAVNSIKTENNSRYDYSRIKFLIPEAFSAEMLTNAEIRNAADIILLDSSSAGAEAAELKEKYGKEIWYTGGEAPSEIIGLVTNIKGGGLSGSGNALDICNRIINSFTSGKASLFGYGSVLNSNYTVTGTFPKALVTAQTPWNSRYAINTGYWTSLHFTGFTDSGWKFVESACFGDGTETDRSISETKNNYITLANPETGDFSIIICNDSNLKRGYTFTVTNLDKADKLLHVWETSGYGDEGFSYDYYNSEYMRLTDEFFAVEQYPYDEEIEADENGLIISENESDTLLPHAFSVTMKPYSVMVITTLDRYGEIPVIDDCEDYSDTSSYDENFAETFSLPWNDDYEYDEDFLYRNGSLPKYTQDLSGVFEVSSVPDAYGDDNCALVQTAKQNESYDYPLTIFGDNRWSDYTAQIDFLLDDKASETNFVQLGVRSTDPFAETGYSFRIYQNSSWELRKNTEIISSGALTAFIPSEWHTIIVTAVDNTITVYIDDNYITEFTDNDSFINSGRISIASAYYKNSFDNLLIDEAETGLPYIVRVDDMDYQVEYIGLHGSDIISFYDFNCTLTTLEKDAGFNFRFYGSEISFIGSANSAKLKITIDGEEFEEEINAYSTNISSVAARLSELGEGSHTVTVELLSGEFVLNYIEYS